MSDWNVEKVLIELARIMNLRGISNRELSRGISKNDSYVNKIMNGNRSLSMEGFLKMCEKLGIEPSDFFDSRMDSKTVTGKIVQYILKMSPKEQEYLLLLWEEKERQQTRKSERTKEERDFIGTGNAKANNRK